MRKRHASQYANFGSLQVDPVSIWNFYLLRRKYKKSGELKYLSPPDSFLIRNDILILLCYYNIS